MTAGEGEQGELTAAVQRWVLVQLGLAELVGTLGYAEVLGVYAAGLGVRGTAPERLVWTCIEGGLAGPRCWQPAREAFPALVRRRVREQVADQVDVHARIRGGGGARARLAAVQLGGLRGLAALAHGAAEMGAFVRASDEALVPIAVRLLDRLRRRLAGAAGPDAVCVEPEPGGT